MCTIDQFCKRQITLSRIKAHLTSHWHDVAYELIEDDKVKNIKCSSDTEENKCFTMLKTWLETDKSPCYCKLFTALERYKHFHIIKNIKDCMAM